MAWQDELNFDPIETLLSCGNPSIEYFLKDVKATLSAAENYLSDF